MALLTMRSLRICWTPLPTGRYIYQQQRMDMMVSIMYVHKDSVHGYFGAENVLQI